MHPSPLQLERSYVSRLAVEAAEHVDPTEGTPPSPEIHTHLEISRHPEDPTLWMLALDVRCEVQEPDEPGPHPTLPYTVDLRIHGIFSVPRSDEEPSVVARRVGIHGASLLYSAAREHVLLVTGRGPWGPFQLPTVSFRGTKFEVSSEE